MQGIADCWEQNVSADPSLLNRVIELYERREQSVAEQIHERFAQKLLGALLYIQACEHLESRSETADKAFGTAKEALGEVIEEAHRLVSQLRFPLLDKFNVVYGIDYLIDEMDGRPNGEIEFLHPDRLTRMLPRVEIAVFRVVQELLSNACRHSRAKKIRVKLAQDANRLRIEVRDWGVGFDLNKVTEGVFGLQSVRDRVELLGGRIDVYTAPGQGTQVVVELPLETKNEDITASRL